MPSDQEEAARAPTPADAGWAQDTDAAGIAAAVVARWEAIDAALRPVVGGRGVAALYGRSLTLAGARHPWLLACRPGLPQLLDTSALHQALLQQPAAEASAAGTTLSDAFRGLLNSLIGAPLAERLLRDASPPASTAAAAKDPAP
jgi:hypothetical protein